MKTAMVWGASGGIGRAVVKRLAQDDWTVIAIGRDELALPQEATHFIEAADVADETAVRDAVREASFVAEAVDLFVYAVGDINATKVSELDQSCWQRIMAANLSGAYLTTAHSLPLFAEDAHLMFIGAIHERLRLPGFAAYAAAKAGLEAFADALRKEQRQRHITVVRPGAVDTPLWDKVPLKVPKDAMTAEKLADKILSVYENQQSGTIDFAHS